MGHKWMWNASLGGLPPEQFLAKVDLLLVGVREKLDGEYATSDHLAGHLSAEWAKQLGLKAGIPIPDRKSTRLNSSHGYISYAVFCLKKKKNTQYDDHITQS